ncbi:hypothetical protein Ae201684P_010231 [Aphanomyces euteiches]|uniref:CMP/dCMP-type deaminase domain-containing protein n=1 Tax=Aphanomyces euteiches TaxID=100861 RepID=A0A6G0X0B0_9STRA|nr:hypothetical protein Ae201684_009835 [Aphanomyces euteiches]KAH9096028.1 hypothetical protein Ae201684P_010231 [Aphanomyces euteiches]KAH9143935.1 hypothetical protein AeRB84_012095 [Aphanomyces euteiches]
MSVVEVEAVPRSFDERLAFHAIAFPSVHGASVMKSLVRMTLSLRDMGYPHLKRMKKQDAKTLLALVSTDADVHAAVVDALSPDVPCESSVVHIPKYAPINKEELAIGNAVWPLIFHAHPTATPLSTDQAARMVELMDSLLATSKNDSLAVDPASGCCCSVAMVYNPGTDSVLARVDGVQVEAKNPLIRHAAMRVLEAVGEIHVAAPPTSTDYLCTGMDIFLPIEPCVMCSMALVHSRANRVIFAETNPTAGALGSCYTLHGQASLNHRYRVFRVLQT